MTRIALSVVIPAYRQAFALGPTLRAVTAQSLPTDQFEVIVVDDCSPGNEIEQVVADAAVTLNVKYLRNEVNSGRSFTRNRGAEHASGEIVLFLDADSLAAPRLIEQHLTFHRTALRPGVLMGGRSEPILANLQAVIDQPGVFRPGFEEQDPRHALGVDDPYLFSAAPWLFAYSHNVSMPKVAFDAIGGFDELMTGWGSEDIDLAYRLFCLWNQDATRFVFDASAVCHHMPHLRNHSLNRESAGNAFAYLRAKYRHRYFERLPQSEIQYLATSAEYEKVLAKRRDVVAEISLPNDLLSPSADDRPVLYVGCHLSSLTERSTYASLVYDHAMPSSESNPHLLGLDTGLADDSLHAVVHVDLWRMMTIGDLSNLVVESFRVAPELHLVQTSWASGTDDLTMPYAADMLRGFGYDVTTRQAAEKPVLSARRHKEP